ncbi:MAG TPA: response regulator transcription factor [Terriglobales bacterium]|nr:response regulator transcription factor [Terriglobales bacterium]
MPDSIRIIIADDHAILRESLAALLGSQPDMQVIAMTSTGAESIQAAREQRPDVLLLDLFMPGGDGFEVLRTLDRSGAGVATVVLTASENQNDYVQVVQLGARGLVLKGDKPDKLFTAIRTVANGELAFSEDIAQQVLSAMAGKPQKDQTAMRRLSDREKQIAALVARGMKNKDIAAELKISENTVKRHLQSIFSKTGARDRLELAVLALTEFTRAA